MADVDERNGFESLFIDDRIGIQDDTIVFDQAAFNLHEFLVGPSDFDFLALDASLALDITVGRLLGLNDCLHRHRKCVVDFGYVDFHDSGHAGF